MALHGRVLTRPCASEASEGFSTASVRCAALKSARARAETARARARYITKREEQKKRIDDAAKSADACARRRQERFVDSTRFAAAPHNQQTHHDKTHTTLTQKKKNSTTKLETLTQQSANNTPHINKKKFNFHQWYSFHWTFSALQWYRQKKTILVGTTSIGRFLRSYWYRDGPSSTVSKMFHSLTIQTN